MSKMIQTPWEAMQANCLHPTKPKSNTYEKHIDDQDTTITVYDSQGRMLEVKSVYGAFATSDESEGNDNGNCNA